MCTTDVTCICGYVGEVSMIKNYSSLHRVSQCMLYMHRWELCSINIHFSEVP